jgi:hypothetical protein
MLFQLQPNLSTAHFVLVDSSANDRPSHKAFRNSRDAFAESTGAAAMDLLQSEGFLSKHASVLFLETFTEAQLLHPAHLPAQVNRTECSLPAALLERPAHREPDAIQNRRYCKYNNGHLAQGRHHLGHPRVQPRWIAPHLRQLG